MDEVESRWQELEKTGEEKAGQRLAGGCYGPKRIHLVRAWLKKKEEERALHQQQRRDTREEQSLRLAREANEISRGANRVAFWAFVAAAIGVVVSLIALFRG